MSSRRMRRASRATATGQPSAYAIHWAAPCVVERRRIGTSWTVTPASASSGASCDGPGRAMWKSNSARGRLRASRTRAWSEPPRSATGWTERILVVRVAINVEQLLQPAPGGIGRYTAELVRLLPERSVDLVAFAANHARKKVEKALEEAGVPWLAPVVLRLPRPLLYDAW